MKRNGERGFSFAEFLMAATMLSFVSTGVKTFVFERGQGSRRPIAARKLAGQGRASVEQMVRELERASYAPQNGAGKMDILTPARLNEVEATFLVAADQVVFEADLDGDSVVERVEYRLHESALWRSAVSKNPDGSLPAARYQLLTEYVENGSLPLFRYETDPFSDSAAPGNVKAVWVSLLLRPPVLDSKRPQFRTLRFDGLASLPSSEHGTSFAGLREP